MGVRKRYTSRKYAKYNEKETVSKFVFYGTEMHYVVLKGLIYLRVALITINPQTNQYGWSKNPKAILNKMASKLIGIVLDEKSDNPDVMEKMQIYGVIYLRRLH